MTHVYSYQAHSKLLYTGMAKFDGMPQGGGKLEGCAEHNQHTKQVIARGHAVPGKIKNYMF